MREIRLSGSEGGGFECNRFSLPLSSRGYALQFCIEHFHPTAECIIQNLGFRRSQRANHPSLNHLGSDGPVTRSPDCAMAR